MRPSLVKTYTVLFLNQRILIFYPPHCRSQLVSVCTGDVNHRLKLFQLAQIIL